MTITWTSSGISTISLSLTHRTRVRTLEHSPPTFVTTALQRLHTYFRSEPTIFSDIPLDPPSGTPFQHAVWSGCQTIPWGQTRSYAWLASHINRPTAVRAVANALGRNPLPIIIPCHRVIRSDGTLGGFTLGLPIKTKLLRLESVSIPNQTR